MKKNEVTVKAAIGGVGNYNGNGSETAADAPNENGGFKRRFY